MEGWWRGAIRALLLPQCQQDLLHGQVKLHRQSEREDNRETDTKTDSENQVDEIIQIILHYYAYIQSSVGQSIFNFM